MAKATYFGDTSNKARKGKKTYFGDTSNKARKVKKMYIGDANNKARLFFAGSLVGKVHGALANTSTLTKLMINNPNGEDDSSWSLSITTSSAYLPIQNSAASAIRPVYAFDKFYYSFSKGLLYTVDGGVTFTQCPTISLDMGQKIHQITFNRLFNCDGRLFGVGTSHIGGGSQYGAGGTDYYYMAELNSDGGVIKYQYFATNYTWTAYNNPNGATPYGTFETVLHSPTYYNGYIYYLCTRRGTYTNSNSNKLGRKTLSLCRYNINANTIETLKDTFWEYLETAQTQAQEDAYNDAPFMCVYGNVLLIQHCSNIYKYDISTSSLSTVTNTLPYSSSKDAKFIRINNDTFMFAANDGTKYAYKFNGTTLTLTGTSTAEINFNYGITNQDVNSGDRYVNMYVNQNKTGSGHTFPVNLEYTFDGLNFTNNAVLSTPSSIGWSPGTRAIRYFALYFVPN